MKVRYILAAVLVCLYFVIFTMFQPSHLTPQDGVQQVTSNGHSVVQYNANKNLMYIGWVIIGGIAICLCVPQIGKSKI